MNCIVQPGRAADHSYNSPVSDYHVFTIGHGESTWEEFIFRLRPYGIEALIDVRSHPYTFPPLGTPWFDRDRIEPLARRQGWEYLWLGGKVGALTVDGRVDNFVREQEAAYRSGIGELLDLAGERTVCLLGGHSDPFGSHVHTLISQTLLRHHVGVRHILMDGTLAEAYADLFHTGI
jgi:uncharacterized protein (DUF488 family)